jgi:hypothetical protein
MTLEEIKKAVLEGKTVHWSNTNYVVVKDNLDQWLINCPSNGYCIGLTWSDGKTLNGKEEDFYVAASDDDRLVLMREALLDLAEEVKAVAHSLAYCSGAGMPFMKGTHESRRLENIAYHMTKAAQS